MTNQSNSTMTCQHKHHVLNGTSFSCNSPTNCSGSTAQRELTFCLEPSMLIAVSRIKTRAKWPGLHNSFSSWPIITASESISTSGSMPFRFACFDVMENGPEWQTERQQITTPQLMLWRIYSCHLYQQLQGMTELIRFTFWIHHCDLIHCPATPLLIYGWPLYQKSCTKFSRSLCLHSVSIFFCYKYMAA